MTMHYPQRLFSATAQIFDMSLAFLDGKTSTTLTFEWTYNVRCSVPLNLSGLDEQTVSADITFTNNNGVVTAAFAG